MRFESTIVIRRNPDEVRRFLAEPLNLPKWDRGVAAVEMSSPGNPPGVGSEFTTVGHSGSGQNSGRMTYRIAAADPDGSHARAQLTSRTGNARFFTAAEWFQTVEDAPEGSRVTFSTEFRLRFRYLFLVPILSMIGNRALRMDVVHLRDVLENSSSPATSESNE